MESRPGPHLRQVAVLLAHSGDSPIWVIVLLIAFFWPGWSYRALVIAAGVLLTALVVQALKWTIRRPRPTGDWGTVYRRIDPHSFPSGHAARAAFLALAAVHTGPFGLALLLCLWAPLVALARVALRVHYLSDVVMGALCGLICAVAVILYISF